jgi:plastocyanin
MGPRGLAASLLLAALVAAPACTSPKVVRPGVRPPERGTVHGTLYLPERASKSAGERPVVVYLDRTDGRKRPRASRGERTVRQEKQGLSPGFLAVAAGQTVRFSNEDEVYHHTFSSSRPNAFDLGRAGRGETREVTLRHPGVVRVYCALHPWEQGVIFVAPLPYFDTVEGPGSYEIREVPPGRYRLGTWSETGPGPDRTVSVGAGKWVRVEIPIESGGENL